MLSAAAAVWPTAETVPWRRCRPKVAAAVVVPEHLLYSVQHRHGQQRRVFRKRYLEQEAHVEDEPAEPVQLCHDRVVAVLGPDGLVMSFWDCCRQNELKNKNMGIFLFNNPGPSINL